MAWEKELKSYKQHLIIEKGLASNTVSAYIADLNQLANHIDSSINEIKLKDIYTFIQQANITNKRTINRKISSLKNFLVYCQGQGVHTCINVKHLESPKLPQSFPDYLTEHEIADMLGAAKKRRWGTRDHMIIKLLYALGLRVSEAVVLTERELNLEEGFARVLGKGSKQRLVPIYDELGKQIREYLIEKKIRFPHSDFFFVNQRGARLSRVSMWKTIKELARVVGIRRNIYTHTLRHSFATHLLVGGADIRSVQMLLGHEDLKTTEIYTHLNTTILKETVEKFHPMYH